MFIPDPGSRSQKGTDPGSESATLNVTWENMVFQLQQPSGAGVSDLLSHSFGSLERINKYIKSRQHH